MNNVKDCGAVGDGATKDTAAIQKAIDAGGAVYFPPGKYLTGTLYLRSSGGLELAPGAVIIGSPDKEDYNQPDFCPQNVASPQEKASGAHLIVAHEVDHVFIRGFGRIDGNRKAFFDPAKYSRDQFVGWRPSQMLYFCESADIHIEGIELTNSPYWSCFLFGCKDVFVRGVKIENDPAVWNGDGIDVDSCRYVAISDCIIRSSDDSIAIRASGEQLLQKTEDICEFVTVTNCTLSSNQAGIRVGVGNGKIRNCTFSNICIEQAGYGLCLLSTYLPREFPEGAEGVEISNILFDNIVVNARAPFDITSNWINDPLPESRKTIRDIMFRGIRARGIMTSMLQGNLDKNVSDIIFSDISLELSGGAHIQDLVERVGAQVYHRPYGFYMVHAANITFNRVNIRWRDELDAWKYTIYSDDVDNFELNGCKIAAPVNGAAFFNKRLDAK